MNNLDQKTPQEELNSLKKANSLLLNLCNELYNCAKETCQLESDMRDDNNRMILFFCERQKNHMSSFLKIVDTDDATLIARSMFEGMIYLLSSRPDKDNGSKRMDQWFLYPAIKDLEKIDKLKKDRKTSELPDKNYMELLESRRKRVQELFWNNKQKKYYPNWTCNESIRQLANISGETPLNLYEDIYRNMSKYHHWDTIWFASRYKVTNDNKSIQKDPDNYEFSKEYDRRDALIIAFQSLSFSLQGYLIATNRKATDLFQKIKMIEKQISEIPGIKGIEKEVKFK